MPNSNPSALPPAGPVEHPGLYLAMRRAAAGLDLDDVAAMISTPRPNDDRASLRACLAALDGLRARLTALEAHDIAGWTPADHMRLIDRLQGAFSFDRHVYFALIGHLADPRTPLPPICRKCACSWQDACRDPVTHDTCAWANAGRREPPLCSFCVETPARPKPLPAAGAGQEAAHAA